MTESRQLGADAPSVLAVRPYDWAENRKGETLELMAYSMDRDDHAVCVRIRGFPVVCYVELPQCVSGFNMVWAHGDAQLVYAALRERLGSDLFHFDFGYMSTMYFYKGEGPQAQVPAMLLCFKNQSSLWALSRAIRDGLRVPGLGVMRQATIRLTVHESELSNLLKFWSYAKLLPCQWIRVCHPVAPEEAVSIADYEYCLEWREIAPIPPEESQGWITHPLGVGFDGEMYAANHKAMPKRYVDTDECYMISFITEREDIPSSRKRYVILIGRAEDIDPAKTRDSTVIASTDEIDMLHKFAALMREVRPQLRYGYNQTSFDWWYIDFRLERVGLPWPNISMLKRSDATYMPRERVWSSSACGKVYLRIPEAPGSFDIDMLLVVRRDRKMDTYTLDAAAKEILGPTRGKHDVSPQRMFEIYERYMAALRAYRAHEAQCSVPADVVAELQAAAAEYSLVVGYCVEDTELVMDIKNKLKTWRNIEAQADIFQVEPKNIYTRGQQIRIVSQIYMECRQDNVIFDTKAFPPQFIQGALVGDPPTRRVDEVITLDFKGMYPTIMQEYNICWSTFVPIERRKFVNPDDCHIVPFQQVERKDLELEVEKDKEKGFDEDDFYGGREKRKQARKKDTETVVRDYETWWYKRRPGFLARRVAFLVKTRNVWKAIMGRLEREGKKDSFEYAMADIMQNGYKIAANSMFGILGCVNGRMPLPYGAMTITALGRIRITKVNDHFRQKYNAYIPYGDTDSAFLKFPHVHGTQELIAMGKQAAIEATQLFGGITEVDFEKCGDVIFLKAKKYIMYIVDVKTGKYQYLPHQILKRGNALQRREYCKALRKIYGRIMVDLGPRVAMEHVVQLLIDNVHDHLTLRMQLEDLKMYKEYKGNYKQQNYELEVYARYLASNLRPIQPGDRVEYILAKRADVSIRRGRKGEWMRDPQLHQEQLENAKRNNLPPSQYEVIDPVYYVQKQLMKPVEQLFQAAFRDELYELGWIGYQPRTKQKPISLFHPVEMILQMFLDGIHPSLMLDWIRNPPPRPVIQLTLVA